MAHPLFEVDGNFSVWRENNILFSRHTGSWNQDTAQIYSQALIHTAKPICHNPWAHLVYMDDWDLGAIEMQPVIQVLVKWCVQNNLIRAAHIYSPNMAKTYCLDNMVLEHEGKFALAKFSSEKDALHWLSQEGFSTVVDG